MPKAVCASLTASQDATALHRCGVYFSAREREGGAHAPGEPGLGFGLREIAEGRPLTTCERLIGATDVLQGKRRITTQGVRPALWLRSIQSDANELNGARDLSAPATAI